MKNTIKLLQITVSLLYVSFVLLILETIGSIITGIVLAAVLKIGEMLWISASSIITIIILIIINEFIKLTKGSLEEHRHLDERLEQIDQEYAKKETAKASKKKAASKVVAPVVETPVTEENEEKLVASTPEQEEVKEETPAIVIEEEEIEVEEVEPAPKPEYKEPEQVRVKQTDFIVNDDSFLVNGEQHKYNEIIDLSAVGNELRFFIGEVKYIIEFDYFSESSKMYDVIDEKINQ